MNFLYCILLCVAFTVIELLIGGTRLLFSLPAYLVLAVAAVLSIASLRRPKLLPDRRCLVATLLFMAYIVGRGLLSPVAYTAWPDEFMVLGALIVYLLTACYLTDPRRRLWVLACLLALGLVNLVVGVHQFGKTNGFMLFGFLRAEQYAGRASGLYVCPDHLAFFLEVVGCLCLSAATWGRVRAWVKLVFGYGALCLFGGSLLTASRGGFLSAAVGLSVLMVLGLLRAGQTSASRLGRVAALGVVVAVLAGLGLRAAVSRSALLNERAHMLITMQDIRPRLWKAGIAQFRLAPVFGTGAATYLYYGRRLRDPVVQADPIRTHNDYLELLGEYGAVGALGLIFFLGTHLWTGWRGFRRFSLRADEGQDAFGGTSAAWNIGALAAVAAVMAHSVVDFNLHIPANTLLTAFVFGILANPGRSALIEDTEDVSVRWLDLWPRMTLPVLGLLLLVTGAPRLPGEYFCEKARVALRDHHDLAASILALKGLRYETRNPHLYFYLGEARLNLAGDGPDTPLAHSFRAGADEAFQRGVALAPCDTALLLRHAQLLTIFGDSAGAEQVMAQALLWDPNSALVQTYNGFYLQRRGEIALARAAYARALQLSPNTAAASGLEQVSKLGVGANN